MNDESKEGTTSFKTLSLLLLLGVVTCFMLFVGFSQPQSKLTVQRVLNGVSVKFIPDGMIDGHHLLDSVVNVSDITYYIAISRSEHADTTFIIEKLYDRTKHLPIRALEYTVPVVDDMTAISVSGKAYARIDDCLSFCELKPAKISW